MFTAVLCQLDTLRASLVHIALVVAEKELILLNLIKIKTLK